MDISTDISAARPLTADGYLPARRLAVDYGVRFPELLHGGGAAEEARETFAALRHAVFPAADGSTRDGKSARGIHPANTRHYVAVCALG